MRNDTDATVRVLMFSTRKEVAVAVYPDSDKIGIFTGNSDDNVMVRRSSGVDYYDGEAGRPPAPGRPPSGPSDPPAARARVACRRR